MNRWDYLKEFFKSARKQNKEIIDSGVKYHKDVFLAAFGRYEIYDEVLRVIKLIENGAFDGTIENWDDDIETRSKQMSKNEAIEFARKFIENNYKGITEIIEFQSNTSGIIGIFEANLYEEIIPGIYGEDVE